MKILMTGGTGFIGSHLIKSLEKKRYSFVNITEDRAEDYEYIETLIRENNFDCLVHLATFYKSSDAYESIDSHYNSNVIFPIKLFTIAQHYGIKKFINASSMFKFGNQQFLPIDEYSELNPVDIYAVTKLNFETFLRDYFCKLYNVNVITLNLFSPYGIEDKSTKIVQQIINAILTDTPLRLTSSGFQKLDWTYVDDVIEAYIKCIEMTFSDRYQEINIASGECYSVRDMISILENISGKVLQKEYSFAIKPAILNSVADISTAKAVLDWEPLHTLMDGLYETYEYYKNKYEGKK